MAFGFGKLGELVVTISTDLTNFNAGLKSAQTRLQQTRGAILQSSRQIGRSMTIMGAAMAGGLALTAKAAIDFESAFAGVRKTVDATEKEFQQLSDNFRQLSKEIPVTAVELSKIGEIAGQLGVRGVANLTKFTKNVAMIARTTNLTAEEASFAFARIASITQTPIDQIDKMASSVVALGNNFEVVETEITTFAQRIAASGKNAGLTTDEILGVSAAFASVGIQAEAGGTAVNNVLLELQKQGKSGIGALTEFINDLTASGDQAALKLEEMGFKSARLQRAFLSVAGAGGKLNKVLDLSKKAYEENTALQIEAAKRFETVASQLIILKGNITDVSITLGEILLPMIIEVINKIKPLIAEMKEWIEANPELTNQLLKMTVVISGLMLVLGPLLMMLPGLAVAFNLVTAAVIALTISIKALAFGLAFVTNPLIKIAAIGASAFVGWKIGRLIGETTGLDKAMEKFFLNMFIWIDKAKADWRSFWRVRRGEEEELPLSEMQEGGSFIPLPEEVPPVAEEPQGFEDIRDPFESQLPEGPASEVTPEETSEKIEDVILRKIELEQDFAKLITKLNQSQLKSLETRLDKEIKLTGKNDKKKKKAMELALKAVKKDSELRNQIMADGFTFASTLISAFGKDSIGAAIAMQALRIGEIIVNGMKAVSLIQATIPPPASIPLVAKQNISTALQVATAAAQTFAGFVTGTDSVPAMLSPGEMVVPRTFADAIRAGDLSLSGDGGAGGARRIDEVNINITLDNVQIASDIDIDELTEQLGEDIEEKLRRV